MANSAKIERLEFLDGLRGWAALVVLASHLFEVWMLNYQLVGGRELYWLLDRINSSPLGVAMDGTLAIHIFFCISGVALSLPIIMSATRGQNAAILALQRYPRLTLPILTACVLTYFLWATGCFVNVEAAARAEAPWLAGFYRFEPRFANMLSFALWRVYFDYEFASSWNAALWTMPVELLGSFIVFFVTVALPRPFRLLVCAIAIAILYDKWVCGFFAGVIIADAIASGWMRQSALAGTVLLIAAMGAAIAARSPHTKVVFFTTTPGINVIAALTVIGCAMTPWAKAFLKGRISQFLGAVSFSLYLVHIPIICSFSSAVFLMTIDRMPYIATVGIVAASTTLVALSCATLFHVVVERWALGLIKAAIANAVRQAASHWPFARPSQTFAGR